MGKSKSSGIGAVASMLTGGVAMATVAVYKVVAGVAAGTVKDAALTSGLAVVGGIVGGGMAAGIVVVTAATILCGIVGFGLYKLYKKLATSESLKPSSSTQIRYSEVRGGETQLNQLIESYSVALRRVLRLQNR